MTIIDIVRQGLQYAYKCRSLWLFGFIVGLAAGGSSGGGNGGGHDQGGAAGAVGAAAAAAAGGGFPFLSGWQVWLVVGLVLVVAAAGVVLRFLAEGALIEGIARARRGGTLTTREGFRAGWAHWGVIVRIALLYAAAIIASVALLAAPCALAFWTLGPIAGVVLAIPAVLVLVPWLVTLSVVQEFAWRIAVLENRRAIDAVRKARLFLHGRLVHGLKLLVATFIGSIGFGLATIVAIVPVALLGVGLWAIAGVVPAIVLCVAVLVPVIGVLTAMLGTFRSSIWTLGYVTQVES
jgi:hypothetical protein